MSSKRNAMGGECDGGGGKAQPVIHEERGGSQASSCVFYPARSFILHYAA